MSIASLIVLSLAILGALGLGYLWWTQPDDLESVRQREKALEVMRQWTS